MLEHRCMVSSSHSLLSYGICSFKSFRNIARPDPTPGATLELPLLGSVLTVTLPLPYQAQYPSIPSAPSPAPPIPPAPPPPSTIRPLSIPATHPLTPLSFLLFSSQSPSSTNQVGFTKLLLIWELLVLGESLLIYCQDPKTGSELIAHFKNLIRPVRSVLPSPNEIVKSGLIEIMRS